MKKIKLSRHSEFSSRLCLFSFLLLIPYQEVSSADRGTGMETLNGKVIIKLEPHGSIRAKVFQGKTLQYEFILDRETPQKVLTQRIDSANIYLVGKYGEELVIDDLIKQKRYVLSIFDRTTKRRTIPSARSQTITIKGYSTSLLQ